MLEAYESEMTQSIHSRTGSHDVLFNSAFSAEGFGFKWSVRGLETKTLEKAGNLKPPHYDNFGLGSPHNFSALR